MKICCARLEAILPEIEGGAEFATRLGDDGRQRLLALMPALKERAKTLVDLFHAAKFLFADRPLQLDEKAGLLLDQEARARLRQARDTAFERGLGWRATRSGRAPVR